MYCCPFNNIKLYTKYNTKFTSSILWSSAVALFRNTRNCVTLSAGYCSENKQTLIYKLPTHHRGTCSPDWTWRPHLEGVFHTLTNLSSIKTLELYWGRGHVAFVKVKLCTTASRDLYLAMQRCTCISTAAERGRARSPGSWAGRQWAEDGMQEGAGLSRR